MPGEHDHSKSQSIWAVVTDGEGIAGVLTPSGWLSLVTLSERNVPKLQDWMATLAAAAPTKTFRLVRFSGPVDCAVSRASAA